MSATRRHDANQEHSVQTAGFWIFGFLSVVLAVLKLTVAGYWSWWRGMLPLQVFVGHNALYILTGLLCFRRLEHPVIDGIPKVPN